MHATRVSAPYYELKKEALTCPGCGWQGLGADLNVSEIFESGIIEYVCSKCAFDIAFAAGPTPWETEQERLLATEAAQRK